VVDLFGRGERLRRIGGRPWVYLTSLCELTRISPRAVLSYFDCCTVADCLILAL